ncbi:NAD(P)H-hydrate dehydratase [Xanthomonas sp. XNM01]|uniref:NAD(P)H-hydrate dehydratase n=1 Tax=Xanthomonas sp. XNM01 TaxID=2769289 RepID=UPI00177FCE17|nr:NAD(P)H-hydrate dehydratase [Xanthomonas sp. XNM01]MBD9368621.1 NAD(P)H-hydrate dehydratase [Xanthomonas sp. XNM01]
MTAPRVRALTPQALRRMPLPPPGEDKEERGRALVIGGSRHVPGAALLAAESALRAGAGKLQVATAASVATGMALAVPEALVLGLAEDRRGEIARGHRDVDAALRACAAVAIGPGMRDGAGTHALVQRVLALSRCTVVLDAGALTADLDALPAGRCVLTPHAGEMAAITGASKEQIQAAPADHARALALRIRSVVILKGADTHVADADGGLWRHRGGVPGLGTSGSGDTLAGLIIGFAARGADPLQAALWGVVVHAQAGRALARSVGSLGFLAREIPPQVPGILDRLQRGAR